MRKTNLIKTIICGAMITLMCGTTVFAGNYVGIYEARDNEVVANYAQNSCGAYGVYRAVGDGTQAKTNVLNLSGGSRLFRISVVEMNQQTRRITKSKDASGVLNNAVEKSAIIMRNNKNFKNQYIHYIEAYASTSGNSGTLVDTFKFTLIQ